MLPITFHSKKLSLLFLGAHCDDIEIGCGGTILRLLENHNIESVSWHVFTSDQERRNEAVTSANFFLGELESKHVEIKQFRDGFLPYQAAEIKDEFERIRKGVNPDIIFTHYRNDCHQDHRLISDLTWNTWRDHLILEYEIPKYDGDFGSPNFFVGIEGYLQTKIKYIREAFLSQYNKHWFDEDTFSAVPRLRGIESSRKYSEAFYLRKMTL